MKQRAVIKPEKKQATITLELSDALNARLIDLANPFRRSIEDAALFLLEQAINAPPPALEWMKEKCVADQHTQPSAKTSFEAYGAHVRKTVLLEKQAELDFANATAAFIASAAGTKR